MVAGDLRLLIGRGVPRPLLLPADPVGLCLPPPSRTQGPGLQSGILALPLVEPAPHHSLWLAREAAGGRLQAPVQRLLTAPLPGFPPACSSHRLLPPLLLLFRPYLLPRLLLSPPPSTAGEETEAQRGESTCPAHTAHGGGDGDSIKSIPSGPSTSVFHHCSPEGRGGVFRDPEHIPDGNACIRGSQT